MNGFDDLMITGNTNGTFGTVYCSDDYSSSCLIDEEQWKCDGGNGSICDTAYTMDTTLPIEGYKTASMVVDPFENTSFLIAVSVAMTLIVTLCFMRYLLNRKPKCTSKRTVTTNRKPTVEDTEEFSGVIVYRPDHSGSYPDHSSCHSGHTITDTPSGPVHYVYPPGSTSFQHVINDSDGTPPSTCTLQNDQN